MYKYKRKNAIQMEILMNLHGRIASWIDDDDENITFFCIALNLYIVIKVSIVIAVAIAIVIGVWLIQKLCRKRSSGLKTESNWIE